MSKAKIREVTIRSENAPTVGRNNQGGMALSALAETELMNPKALCRVREPALALRRRPKGVEQPTNLRIAVQMTRLNPCH